MSPTPTPRVDAAIERWKNRPWAGSPTDRPLMLARELERELADIKAERDQLRAEVERLTKERDDWAACAKRTDAKMLHEQADHNKTVDRLIECRAALAAAQKDAERLEFLAVNAAEVRVEWDDGEGPIPPEFSIVAKGTGVIGRGPTLRAAIDAARGKGTK